MKLSEYAYPWLRIQAEKSPDNAALISGEKITTFGDLFARAGELAESLAGRGISAGSHVAVACRNSEKAVELIHALLLLRSVIVPINIRLTENDIERYISFAECSDVITDNTIDTLGPAKHQSSRNALLLMFTSGTTGDPKCAEITHENVFYNAVATKLRLGVSGDDSWLLSLPLYHIGGISIVLRSVLYGIPVIVPSNPDTDSIIEAIYAHTPSMMSFVPTMMYRIVERGVNPIPSHRSVLLGGGPVSKDLFNRFTGDGWKIAMTYGATEASSQITTKHPLDEKNPGSAGMPLPGTNVRIIQEDETEVPPGTEGEITVRSPSLMRGYYRRPDMTEKVIRDGWYHTGDYGYCTEDGYLYVVSRRDDLIVSGGENVNPVEVEHVLREHPSIADVCVFPYPDDEWGEIVACAIVIRGGDINLENIKRFVTGKIPSFMIPKRIFIVERLPYNEYGKVNRRLLHEQIKDNYR
jgi:o-succinylbenzoate---CoA ligase